MMLFDKNLAIIAEETLADLEAAGIAGSRPGDITRILLASFNKQLDSFYTTLRVNHVQAFASKATDERLEMVGEIVQCSRLPGESDDNYRYRITHALEDAATANAIAVRLRVLSVGGVQDVIMKPFTHGTGSFSVYVVTEETITPDEILEDVREKLREVKAEGIRAEAYRPIIKEVQLGMRVVFEKGVRESEKSIALSLITEGVQDYLNGLNVGDTLDFAKFETIAREITDKATEVHIFNFKVNGRPVLNKSITPAWNERFVEAPVQNAVYVI